MMILGAVSVLGHCIAMVCEPELVEEVSFWVTFGISAVVACVGAAVVSIKHRSGMSPIERIAEDVEWMAWKN